MILTDMRLQIFVFDNESCENNLSTAALWVAIEKNFITKTRKAFAPTSDCQIHCKVFVWTVCESFTSVDVLVQIHQKWYNILLGETPFFGKICNIFSNDVVCLLYGDGDCLILRIQKMSYEIDRMIKFKSLFLYDLDHVSFEFFVVLNNVSSFYNCV